MTTEQQLGTIEKVSIRQVWPTEDGHFTPWLGENLDKLGAELGRDLEVAETEAEVGPFKLDVRARDTSTDGQVVIENQFGQTDHTHLGQLLTYAGGFDAQAVVWIAESFRDEHRQALDFLNLRTGENTQFFGVEIELWRIGKSDPAPHFKLVAFPNEWRNQTATATGATAGVSPRGKRYQSFFQALIDMLRERHRFTNARRAGTRSWSSFSTGLAGIGYGASFAQGKRARVDIYIDNGDKDWNKRFFDDLEEAKTDIEARFGEPLSWERLDDKRASRIAIYSDGSIDDDDESLETTRQWMVDRLLKFREVFGPRLNELAN